MEFKSISKTDASIIHANWRSDKAAFRVEDQYTDLRNALVNEFRALLKRFTLGQHMDENNQVQYRADLEYGLSLYKLLNDQYGFSMRMAADDGVWRYLAVAVIPDIVAIRWGEDNDDHYWAKPSRNWLRQMWWYICLSWNGNEEETWNVLKSNSTDEILNLVERTGRGYNIETFRHIMSTYGLVSQAKRLELRSGKGRTLFRTIMVMNTAFMQIFEPGLFLDSEKGYVHWLFNKAGVSIIDQ